MDEDEDESSRLIQGDIVYNDPQLDDGNPDRSCPNARKCKVYKRRWYILFVFTLTSIVSNFMSVYVEYMGSDPETLPGCVWLDKKYRSPVVFIWSNWSHPGFYSFDVANGYKR